MDKFDLEVMELGELLEGCLQEEGYKTEEIAHSRAYKFLAVRDRNGKEYTIMISVTEKL